MSVLTLNLWHDAGPYERRRQLIRRWIDELDPDLIGFQEALRGPGLDQVEELLDGRGGHLAYGVASPGWRGELDFGNAVASRWPVLDREVLRLPGTEAGERRAALSVTLDAPGGPLALTCTHLSWRPQQGWLRERQIAAVCALARRRAPAAGFPPVLVGDLNAEPDSAEIRYATGLQSLGGRSVAFRDAWRMAGDGGPGFTWSNRNRYARAGFEPDRRIDYVLVGPARRGGVGQVLRCRVVCDRAEDDVWPTDHFGVYAELASEEGEA